MLKSLATLLQLGMLGSWVLFGGPGMTGPKIIEGPVSGGFRIFEDTGTPSDMLML